MIYFREILFGTIFKRDVTAGKYYMWSSYSNSWEISYPIKGSLTPITEKEAFIEIL